MNASFFGFGPPDEDARAFRPAGLVGARAASRLAGATASGAPTAGSFRKGDAVWGQDGSLWICTAAGSPGTFVQAGFANPLSARGDLIVQGASSTGRLALGANGYVLTSNGSDAVWGVAPAGSGGALSKLAEVGPLGSTQATAAFSSIGGGYRSLLLHWSARVDTSAAQVVQVTLNSDSGANYNWNNVDLAAATNYGLTTNNTYFAAGNAAGTSMTANVFPGGEILILDYTSTAKHKTILTRSLRYDSATVVYQDQNVGFWHNSTPAAITALTLTPSSGNFAANSVFSLYAVS